MAMYVAYQSPKGMIEQGNIDLASRPRVKMKDGSIATVRSVGVNVGGEEVLLPTISPDGKELTIDEAVQRYIQTGEHLGKFDNPEDSTAYAQALHEQQEAMYVQGKSKQQADLLYGTAQ